MHHLIRDNIWTREIDITPEKVIKIWFNDPIVTLTNIF